MPKKFILLLVGIIFYVSANIAFAGVIINEVEISPVDSRFIELYNTENIEVDLTGYYLQRKTATGSSFSSLVSSTNFENKKIKGNGYFLISRGGVTGSDLVISNITLTESNIIQLKNSEGNVIDKICWGEVADCDLLKVDNPPEGKSIQRQNNILIIGDPNAKNSSSNTSDTNTNTNPESIPNNTPSASSGIDSLNSSSSVLSIKPSLKIVNKNFGFVGIPLEFEARLEGVESQNMYAKYIWNFGDGDSMEVDGFDNKKFSHTYYYPGDYLVNIEYFTNSYQANPDYVSKINLKIVPTTVVISSVGTESDFFIELKNNSSLDIDISNWVLLGNNKIFTLPKSTNLLSMKKIILPPRVTNFNHGDKNFLELLDKNGTLIFSYKNILNQPKITTAKTPRKITSLNTENISLSERIGETFVSENEFTDINFENEDLSSAVILSDDKNGEKNNLIYIFLFIILIIFATLTVYFLRRNRKEVEDEEFDILEE